MEQYSQSQENPKQTNAPLKVFEIVILTVAVVFAVWYYYTNFYLQKSSPLLQPEEVRAQRQLAIEKRSTALCPTVQSSFANSAAPFPDKDPFGESSMLDKECVTAIDRLNALDASNALVIRAIKEKNERLCDIAEKSFRDTCVKAVRAGIASALPLSNPILGR